MDEHLDKLRQELGFLSLEKIDIENIDFEKTISNEKSGVIILKDGIVIYDLYNRNIFKLKKDLNISNIYIVTKEEFDKARQFILEKDFDKIEEGLSFDLKEEALDDTEVNKLLHSILLSAIKINVSDVHILPKDNKTYIKFRDSGDLKIHKELPYNYCNLLINKLKSKGDMDITNKMIPQDGKARFSIEGSNVEVRINTLPTIFGENAVLRVQQTDNVFNSTLDSLGFFPEDLEKYRNAFNQPTGMILNVGATGAGKTTTFYLSIAEMVTKYKGEKNIMTVEDPVEIRFPEITQIEADDKQNRGFAEVLRAFMRQDPDIILLGEVRDAETANIAIKASITGHLVLSTLHANDSFNAITRLRDLGVSDTLISSTMQCILSQKLTKKLCPHCKVKTEVSQSVVEKYGLLSNEVYEAVGCSKCNNTGYKGRTAIVEVLTFDEELKTAISNGLTEIELKKIGRAKAFSNLWKNGIKKIYNGDTTLEQIDLVLTKDSIMNSNTNNNSVNLDIRKVFYPSKNIEVSFGDFKGKIFDVSEKGMSIVFDSTKFLNLDKLYTIIVGDAKLDFIAKSYGEIEIDGSSKLLVGGTYKGKFNYMEL